MLHVLSFFLINMFFPYGQANRQKMLSNAVKLIINILFQMLEIK